MNILAVLNYLAQLLKRKAVGSILLSISDGDY
jgi:hypothetical protein